MRYLKSALAGAVCAALLAVLYLLFYAALSYQSQEVAWGSVTHVDLAMSLPALVIGFASGFAGMLYRTRISN